MKSSHSFAKVGISRIIMEASHFVKMVPMRLQDGKFSS